MREQPAAIAPREDHSGSRASPSQLGLTIVAHDQDGLITFEKGR